MEPDLAPVGVLHGHQVERALVDELREPLDPAVALGEIPDRIKNGLAALDLVAVDVAVDEDRGLLGVGPGLRVVEGDQPQVAAGDALADRVEGQQLRIGLGQVVQRLGHLGVVGIVIKPKIDLAGIGVLRPRGSGRETRQQKHGNGTDGPGGHDAPPFSSLPASCLSHTVRSNSPNFSL
jgi:hypothetical protein